MSNHERAIKAMFEEAHKEDESYRTADKVFTKSALDVQAGGSHYKRNKIQPIEYILANELDYIQGNIVKYATRHKYKNGAQDILKIIHYCELCLELEYGTNREYAGADSNQQCNNDKSRPKNTIYNSTYIPT